MAVHLLRFEETGRTLSHTASSPQASATWEIHDLTETIDSAGYVVASGSATADTTSIALSSAAGPRTANPRRLSVASTAGVTVGRTFQIVENGRSEVHEIVGLSTNTYVELRHPLVGTYSTSALIRGLTLTATIPDAVAADEEYVDFDDPLRLVWTYANGEIHQDQVRVVRQDYDDLDFAGILSDIRDWFPDVGQRTEHSGRGTLEGFVRAAIKQQRTEILMDGEHPQRILHGDQGQAIVVWATLRHMAALGITPGSGSDPEPWITYCSEQYRKFWSNTKLGKAGARTAQIAPVTEAAIGPEDPRHRQRLTFG